MKEELKVKTALTTPMGLYQYYTIPFGLCNAPAMFQGLMMFCFGDLNLEHLLLFLLGLADTRLCRVWGTGRITILGYGSFFGCFAPHSTARLYWWRV